MYHMDLGLKVHHPLLSASSRLRVDVWTKWRWSSESSALIGQEGFPRSAAHQWPLPRLQSVGLRSPKHPSFS